MKSLSSKRPKRLRSTSEQISIEKLFQIYIVLRRFISGKFIPTNYLETSWGFSHFEKLQDLLLQYQKDTGIRVDPIIYMKSHFLVYGEKTYPSHLISKHSLDIYRKYREKIASSRANPDSGYQAELDTLSYIAKIRSNTLEETFFLLRNTGLLTEEFIRKWEGEHGEVEF